MVVAVLLLMVVLAGTGAGPGAGPGVRDACAGAGADAVLCLKRGKSLAPQRLGRAKKGLRARGGGVSFEPPEGGVRRSGKGALVTGQSKEAGLKTLMMTHHLPRKAARKSVLLFFKTSSPHDTYLKMMSASWGIILSHVCWGTSGPATPPPPSARRSSPSREL